MIDENDGALVEATKRAEGYRSLPYRCTAGKLTVGYGFNLDAGVSEELAELMLKAVLARRIQDLDDRYPWFAHLTPARQRVCVEMAYQLGMGGFHAFRNMRAAIELGDYERAADQIMDSKMGRDPLLRSRTMRYARVMRRGG